MLPDACRFGVVFALGIEAGCLADLLRGVVTLRGQGFVVRRGERRGRRIVLVQSGPGRTRAASAAQSLLDGHQPATVISAGFAGGLDPKLRRGDIVVADRVLDESGRQCALDLAVFPPSMTETSGVHVGGLLTVERVIRLPEEKRALGEKHAALAADMETLAVAEVCRRRETPFLAVRVINDAADDALPRDVQKLLAQTTGAARLGAAVGSILKRPSSLMDLWRLQRRALEASDRLARFLAALMTKEEGQRT
jgi:adenosylhomocysteine nucleosidase